MSGSMRMRQGTLVALFAILVGWAGPALSQVAAGPESSAAERAISKGKQAVRLFEQQRWSEALRTFREAEALFHSPVFVLYAGRSLRSLGRLLEARAQLESLAAEALDVAAPAQWHKAQSDARAELLQLESEIPTVTLDVAGGSDAARLSIDGRLVTRGVPIELDPGQHRASALEGDRKKDETFTLATRARAQLLLTLPAREVAAESTPRRLSRPAPLPPTRRASAGPYWPGWVLAGSGAAVLAAGGVVGILALDTESELEQSFAKPEPPQGCQGNQCLRKHQPAVEDHFARARRLAIASDILWITGAVLTTAGVSLIVIDPRSKSSSAAVSMSPSGASLHVVF